MIATDLSKQQVLDADPKAMQQINFTFLLILLDGEGQTARYLITENAKEVVLDFAQEIVRVL